MSDMIEMYRDLKKLEQKEARIRRKDADTEWREAFTILAEHEVQFIRHDETFYQIRTEKWVYNIYPGNQRIYADPHHKGPFLQLPDDWTLLDVAKEVLRLHNADARTGT